MKIEVKISITFIVTVLCLVFAYKNNNEEKEENKLRFVEHNTVYCLENEIVNKKICTNSIAYTFPFKSLRYHRSRFLVLISGANWRLHIPKGFFYLSMLVCVSFLFEIDALYLNPTI